jgi:hypothetical protein
MMKIAMSPSATALLRALIARAGVDKNRILLSEVHSTDWQSLTFAGERHQISLRVIGRDSAEVTRTMCAGLESAEFSIPGILVADIGLAGPPRRALDGATEIVVEALTIEED